MTAASESGPPPRTRRWLLAAVYLIAAIAITRAVWLVPRQVAELDRAGYFDRFEPLDTQGDARLSGVVREAWTGEQVPDVGLKITRLPSGEALGEGQLPWDPSAPVEARTDGTGAFEVAVAPGLYMVEVVSDTYDASPWNRVFVGRRAQLPTQPIVVARPLCDLSAELTDSAGAPVVGAEAFLRGGDPGRAYYGPRPKGMASTDGDGRVSWRIWCGSATLRDVAPPGESRRFVELPVDVQPGIEPLRLTLDEVRAAPLEATDPSTSLDRRDHDPGTLQLPLPPEMPDPQYLGSVTAAVVDSAGEPVDAVMMLQPADELDFPIHRSHRFLRGTAFSQEGGRLTLGEVPPGHFRVVLIPAGQPIRSLDTFAVEQGERVDLGTFVVDPVVSSSVQGIVSGPAGPIGGAEVYAVATADQGRLFVKLAHVQWTPRTLSNPDGSYRLADLPPGEVVIVAYHAGVGVSPPTTVAVAGDVRQDLQLVPGSADHRTGWARGCVADLDEKGLFVASIIQGSLAQSAGLLPGDRLLYVDDIPVQWMERYRIFGLLSGEERGVPATVTVQRQGEEDPRVLAWRTEP